MKNANTDEIIDVEDLFEENDFVIVKTSYYNHHDKRTYNRIEIGKKDRNNDIIEFIPIAAL